MTDLRAEIMRARRGFSHPVLRPFLSNITFWELLLIIAELKGDRGYGITDYIEMVETRQCSHLTISNFIRSRIADGSFQVIGGEKKSRKTLILSDMLANALTRFLLDVRRSHEPARVMNGADHGAAAQHRRAAR